MSELSTNTSETKLNVRIYMGYLLITQNRIYTVAIDTGRVSMLSDLQKQLSIWSRALPSYTAPVAPVPVSPRLLQTNWMTLP